MLLAYPVVQAQGETDTAPRTSLERQLAGFWMQLLSLDHVGVYNDFFESGGDSLLAEQLVSRIRETLHVELSIRTFFEMPTIAEVAAHIEKLGWQDMPTSPCTTRDEYTPILSVSREGERPLSFAQQRLWFLDQLEPESTRYHLSRAVRLTGQLDTAALEKSLDEIRRRHEILRTTFPTREGQPVQVVSPHVAVTLPVIDLRQRSETEREAAVQQVIKQVSQPPFDLAHGPLWRMICLQIGHLEHLLVLVFHHIVYDRWSHDVFVKELAVLYEAYATGQPSPLPDLSIQYADFAVWNRHWFQGEIESQHLSYWKRQLHGCTLNRMKLPTDGLRLPDTKSETGHCVLSLPPKLTEDIRRLSQREGGTLFMALLAAFKLLLFRYSGQEDVMVGSAAAGRHWVETEQLILTSDRVL